MKKRTNIILSTVFFVICLCIGFREAYHKPLWNDEIHSQNFNISGKSYLDILQGRIGEGNVSPLFFLIQKAFCDVTQYKIPQQWKDRDWSYQDIRSQILLRINPIVFMSLSIVFIFYYFNQNYSFLAGAYSAAISLSSFMVWHYWAEARLYAFWVFLTTVQTLIFISLLREEGKQNKTWIALGIVQMALCFTLIFSAIQIAVASFLLWIVIDKHRWSCCWKYIIIGVIPASICVFYYMNSPRYSFWFADGPIALLSANIAKERFLIIFGCSLYLLFCWIKNKVKGQINSKDLREAGTYCLFVMGMLLAFALVLLKFKLEEVANQQGFQVSNRYFICLVPIGIIATTLFSTYLVKSSKNKIVRILVILVLGGLLLVRILRTMGRI